MSPDEEEELLSKAMFEKLGFRVGEVVQAVKPRLDRLYHRYDEPIGFRYVVGIADPPYCELFWVRDVRDRKPYGRKFREYATRLRPLEGGALVQMTFEAPRRRTRQGRPVD